MKKMRKKAALGAVVCTGAALLGVLAWGLQDTLAVTPYEITLPQGMEGLDGCRIVQISDLHNADLAQTLEPILKELCPDLIVMTGDLVTRRDREFSGALAVARTAAQTAPTYFVQGNHEADNPHYNDLRQELGEAGVTVLENESVILEYHDAVLNLVGVKDISTYAGNRAQQMEAMGQRAGELFEEGTYHVLLSHRPHLLEAYAASGADLVFSGHAHGGQVRLPGLGALIAPDQGLFPQITEGVHTAGRAQVVVSRGLGNHVPVPRLWNAPELVSVTLRAPAEQPAGG